MAEITVRVATSDADADLAEQLRARARDEAGPQRGGAALLDLWSDPADGALVRTVLGSIDDVVVGYAAAEIVSGSSTRVCMLNELYVHDEARGVGVGSAMVTVLDGWAREAGCDAIESQVLPGNRAAKNFFERLGLVTRLMRVSRRLD